MKDLFYNPYRFESWWQLYIQLITFYYAISDVLGSECFIDTFNHILNHTVHPIQQQHVDNDDDAIVYISDLFQLHNDMNQGIIFDSLYQNYEKNDRIVNIINSIVSKVPLNTLLDIYLINKDRNEQKDSRYTSNINTTSTSSNDIKILQKVIILYLMKDSFLFLIIRCLSTLTLIAFNPTVDCHDDSNALARICDMKEAYEMFILIKLNESYIHPKNSDDRAKLISETFEYTKKGTEYVIPMHIYISNGIIRVHTCALLVSPIISQSRAIR